MARKSKSTEARAHTPNQNGKVDTPKSSKRKIDWATIDGKGRFEGFELKPMKLAKKRKLIEKPGKSSKDWKNAPMSADIIQPNPFRGAKLSATHHEVVPVREWDATQRYRKFTIGQAEFEVGDCVHIKADASQAGDANAPVQGWVAKVLEVRAGDPNHVYLRIYWLYRPEDLPMGRQPYHGWNEVIPSNDMAIVDAMTVDAPAKVVHWQEQIDRGEVLSSEQLFWRQTLEVNGKSPVLSELPKHCIDQAPCNPDHLLIQCDACQKWLHGSCLKKEALRVTYESNDLKFPEEACALAKTKGHKKKSSKGDLAFAAEIITSASGKTRLTLTDNREDAEKKSWNVPIKCLLCSATIEEADEEADEEAATNGDVSDASSGATGVKQEDKPTSIANLPGDGEPRTPANRSTEEVEDEEDCVVGNDISSPAAIRDIAAQAPSSNPLKPNPLESAPEANSYPRNTSRKRKRRATEGSTEKPVKKGKRKLEGATPPPPETVNPSVLQSGFPSIKQFFRRIE